MRADQTVGCGADGSCTAKYSQEAHFQMNLISLRQKTGRLALATASTGFIVGLAFLNGGQAHAIGGLCNGRPASHTWLDASGQYGPALIDGTDHHDTSVGSDGDDPLSGHGGDGVRGGAAGAGLRWGRPTKRPPAGAAGTTTERRDRPATGAVPSPLPRALKGTVRGRPSVN